MKGMNQEALQRLRTPVRLRTMSAATLARLILSLEIFGTGSMSPPTPISTERTQPMSEQVHVEQVDRDFARDWDIECKHCSEYEGNYKADLAEAAAKHRLAGEAAGRASERERIVKWLRSDPLEFGSSEYPDWAIAEAYAKVIERGDHEQGGA